MVRLFTGLHAFFIHFTSFFPFLRNSSAKHIGITVVWFSKVELAARRVHSSAIFALDVVYTHRPDGEGGRLSHVINRGYGLFTSSFGGSRWIEFGVEV